MNSQKSRQGKIKIKEWRQLTLLPGLIVKSNKLFFSFIMFLMHTFMSWNIRGLSNGPSLRRLKKLISIKKLSYFALLETIVTKGTIKEFERKLNY